MAIRSASVGEIDQYSGRWAFVDLGFSEKSKSCGVLFDNGEPMELQFSELCRILAREIESEPEPLNLLLEAPLSVAFDQRGNPTGRAVEKRGSATRYWYVGLGCSVLVAATYLLRSLQVSSKHRDVRLVEGLASFKPKGKVSSHKDDVVALREVVWDRSSQYGYVIGPEKLLRDHTHHLSSAFAVAGMEFGIPPIVVLGA